MVTSQNSYPKGSTSESERNHGKEKMSTMSGKAEGYNEAFKESDSSLFCEEFSKKHPGAEISKEEDIEWEEDDDQISEESQRVKPFLWEMSRYFPPSP